MRILALLAKAPRPGLSKTRLAGQAGLGEEATARLADAFLRDTLRAMRAVPDARRHIFYAPRDAEQYFRELDPAARLEPQRESEFGQRVADAFESAFATGAERVVILGSDTPHLAPALLERAFDELDQHELVLGPCPDGGYYLMGLRRACPRLFEEIDWSSARVRQQTLARAREEGLEVQLLEQQFDIDEAEDLALLRTLLDQQGSDACPHTAEVLAELRGARGDSEHAD